MADAKDVTGTTKQRGKDVQLARAAGEERTNGSADS